MLEQDQQLLAKGYWFNARAADLKMAVFGLMRQLRGPGVGQPIEWTPAQVATVRRLYGWMRDPLSACEALSLNPMQHAASYPRLRRYTSLEKWISKGNGKTGEAAAHAIAMLGFDGEWAAEVDLMSNSVAQTKETLWADVRAYIDGHPDLARQFSLFAESIAFPLQMSHAKMLPMLPRALDGLRTSCYVADEAHEFDKRAAYEKVRMSLKKRQQPLEIIISTMGDNTLSLGYELFESSQHIWRGTVEDPSRLVLIHDSDPEVDDWRSEAVWAGVNPSWGTPWGPNASKMRDELKRLEADPAGETRFRVYHVGQWLSGDAAAIKPDLWKSASIHAAHHRAAHTTGMPRLEELVAAKADFWFGLDLSIREDLTSFVIVARLPSGMYYILDRHYCPGDLLEMRSREHRVDYARWAREGWIVASPGNTTDSDRVVQDVAQVHKQAKFTKGHCDQAFAKAEAQQLFDRHGVPIVSVPQNHDTFTPAARKLQELLAAKRIVHSGNPALTWMCANLSWNIRGDKVAPRKHGQAGSGARPGEPKGRRRFKIDGMVALLLGLHASIVEQPVPEADWSKIAAEFDAA